MNDPVPAPEGADSLRVVDWFFTWRLGGCVSLSDVFTLTNAHEFDKRIIQGTLKKVICTRKKVDMHIQQARRQHALDARELQASNRNPRLAPTNYEHVMRTVRRTDGASRTTAISRKCSGDFLARTCALLFKPSRERDS
jgi:hypothetical protein